MKPTENTDPTASWYHPAMGYDASYYGYGYSDVYAFQCFEHFKNADDLAMVGSRFRDLMLCPAGAKPGKQMLDEFLGEDVDYTPFFKKVVAYHTRKNAAQEEEVLAQGESK